MVKDPDTVGSDLEIELWLAGNLDGTNASLERMAEYLKRWTRELRVWVPFKLLGGKLISLSLTV